MARNNKSTVKSKSELKFYQKLVLNRYLLKQFGAADFNELTANMKNPSLEEIDSEGVTGFYKHLSGMFGEKMKIDKILLSKYDLNIVKHMRSMNERDLKEMMTAPLLC